MTGAEPLKTEQCELLGVLLDGEVDPPDRTTHLLARRVDMSPRQVSSWLEELQARSPPLVELLFDEEWNVQAWQPTAAGRRAYEEGCRA